MTDCFTDKRTVLKESNKARMITQHPQNSNNKAKIRSQNRNISKKGQISNMTKRAFSNRLAF
jgi:hypothetical protein